MKIRVHDAKGSICKHYTSHNSKHAGNLFPLPGMGTLNEPETDFHLQSTEQESPSRVIMKLWHGLPWLLGQTAGPKGSALLSGSEHALLAYVRKVPAPFLKVLASMCAHLHAFHLQEQLGRANVPSYSAVHGEVKWECHLLRSAGGFSSSNHYLTLSFT